MTMTTTALKAPPTTRGYRYDVTSQAPDMNFPQRAGTRLWLPMLVMALMAFPIGVALAFARSAAIADGDPGTTIQSLGHFVPAAMFVGFAAVFAAIAFSIARILGVLRTGGGALQVAAGREVETLHMPATARAFVVLMAIAMMTLVGAVIAHIVVGASTSSGSLDLALSEQWAIWLEGVRRIGVAIYLLSIGLGMATIFTAVRFQTARLTELANEPPVDGGAA
jgi:hypothetical protein